MRGVLRAVLILLAASALVLAPQLASAAPSYAQIDDTVGTPGYCPDGDGVTVVVDFQDLGGDVIVRCAPGDEKRFGLDALKDAGFQVEGVQRWGEGFICRIENEPAADESLSVQGNDSYQEACIDTPPITARWSYWHAPNGGHWEYSQWGVKNRESIHGGFEGWSFSLGDEDSAPEPRIEPTLPDGAAQQAPEQGTEPEPQTGDPDEQAPQNNAPEGGPADEKASGGDDPLPQPLPREDSSAPTAGTQNGVQWTGGEEAPDIDDAVEEQADASSAAPWVAAAAIVVLLALIAVTAIHRRRSRSGT